MNVFIRICSIAAWVTCLHYHVSWYKLMYRRVYLVYLLIDIKWNTWNTIILMQVYLILHNTVLLILFCSCLLMVFMRLDVVILIMLLVLTGNFSQRTKRKPSNRLHTKGHSFLTDLKVNMYPVIDTCLTNLYMLLPWLLRSLDLISVPTLKLEMPWEEVSLVVRKRDWQQVIWIEDW